MRLRLGLRARIGVAVLAVGLPASLALISAGWLVRRDLVLESAYVATLEALGGDGRERCEAGRALALEEIGHPRGIRSPTLVGTWEANGHPSLATTEQLPASVRAALGAATPPAAWDRGRIVIGTGEDGACAIVAVSVAPGYAAAPAPFLPIFLVGLLGVGSLLLTMAVLRDPLRRLARLEAAARGATGAEALTGLEVEGHDEIAAVARALRDSGRRIHEHVALVEQRDETLRDYVAATTHDLALPLTVIQSHVSALLEAAPAEREQSAALRAILVECEYSSQLIANAAAAARMNAEEPHTAKLDLRSVVTRVCQRHETLATQVGVSLDYAVPDLPVDVTGDDLLLERALSNLVHNAIRHRSPTLSNGHVAVLLEHVAVNRARILVASDGDPDGVERVRRALHAPDAHRPRGGLGIVRSICDAHGWHVRVEKGRDGELRVEIATVPAFASRRSSPPASAPR